MGLSYLRIGIYAAVAALVGYLMWREHSLTRVVAKKEAALIVANTTIAQRDGEIEQLRDDMERQRKASNDYQTELERLKAARIDTPTRVVRLCRGTASDVPATPTATGGPSATGAEELPQAPGRDSGTGPDIGTELYALADEADNLAAQCDGLINWHVPAK
jgi:hypothetical protein